MRPPRPGDRWFAVVASTLCVVAVTLVAPGAARAAGLSVPPGYSLITRDVPAGGVEHLVLGRADPPMLVNIARITAGAPVSLRAVLSNEKVAGDEPRLETTSSMCVRVHCLLGVNADFAAVGTGEPLGAFVTDGELLRSPSSTHHQLSLTGAGTLSDETFAWKGRLMTTDLHQESFHGVNVTRTPGKVVLYTPAFGPTTKTATPGVDLVLRLVEPTGELRLGQTVLVELVAINDGAQDGPVPAGGAVLSGDGAGAEALRALWGRISAGTASNQAFLRVDSDIDVRESVGGSPILVKDGKRWFTDPGDNFTNGRHPRTLVGWTPGGDVLLVTVDGRQAGASVGMTLHEAANFLIALGVTDGINLDGGGSTTFVRSGKVVNKVSDVQVREGGKTVVRHSLAKGDTLVGRVERPVASALVVVPSIAVAAPKVDPLAGVALGLEEQALALPSGNSSSLSASAAGVGGSGTAVLAGRDPASAPDGRLPALVGPRPEVGSPFVRVAVVLDGLALAGLAGAAVTLRRRGGLPWRALVPLPFSADRRTPLPPD